MAKLQIELWRQMLSLRTEAWNRLLELMHSTDERVALRATIWFLDRMLTVPAILSQTPPSMLKSTPLHLLACGSFWMRPKPSSVAMRTALHEPRKSQMWRLRGIRPLPC